MNATSLNSELSILSLEVGFWIGWLPQSTTIFCVLKSEALEVFEGGFLFVFFCTETVTFNHPYSLSPKWQHRLYF